MSKSRRGRYWALAGGIAAFVVATFAVFEAFGLGRAFQVDPREVGDAAWAVLGILLLVADILLPIPSSLVMIANGAVFGIAVGSMLSMSGRVAAFAAGYLVGSLGLKRFVPANDATAKRVLSERAWIGIALSRPIPVLSETIAIMAGATGLPFGRSLLAAFAGSIPESIVLAAAGAAVFSGDSTLYAFASLVVVVAIYWLGARIARTITVERV